MNKIFIVIIMLVVWFGAAGAEESKTAKKPVGLIRDGFAFPNSGIEGLVTKSRVSNRWFFSPYSDISDMRVRVLTGWSIELLPSGTLEKIVGEMNADPKKSTLEIKLWGKITKYSNKGASKKLYFGKDLAKGEVFTRNFIFPLNFIPISTVKESAAETATEIDAESQPDKEADEGSDDPTSIIPKEARKLLEKPVKKSEEIPFDKMTAESIIPKDVRNKFKLKHVEKLSKWKKNTVVERDSSLTNRTGFITQGDRYKIFTIDAMGRNVDDAAFKLLECETLQWAEQDIVTSPGRNRYKVSGTITKFKGEYYMLLQRTVKTYNHGNFAR